MSKVYDTEMEISGVKEKRLKRIRGLQMSLRAFVTILVILLSGTILIVYSYLSSKLHYERYMESLMQNISTECKVLSGNLIENDFEIASPIDLNLMIDNMANHFYGRVMIVDADYRIIKDTFGSDTRGYIINRTVIEVMTGEIFVCRGIQRVYPMYVPGCGRGRYSRRHDCQCIHKIYQSD